MSMLSITCTTAIKAVIYLASKESTELRAGILEVSEAIGASSHTVGKILQVLVKAGVVGSIKGPSGGFFITTRQKGLPIMTIVEAIEGGDVFNRCGLGLSACSATHPCPVHDQYKKIRDEFRSMCRNSKIRDLCEPVLAGRAFLEG